MIERELYEVRAAKSLSSFSKTPLAPETVDVVIMLGNAPHRLAIELMMKRSSMGKSDEPKGLFAAIVERRRGVLPRQKEAAIHEPVGTRRQRRGEGA